MALVPILKTGRLILRPQEEADAAISDGPRALINGNERRDFGDIMSPSRYGPGQISLGVDFADQQLSEFLGDFLQRCFNGVD